MVLTRELSQMRAHAEFMFAVGSFFRELAGVGKWKETEDFGKFGKALESAGNIHTKSTM